MKLLDNKINLITDTISSSDSIISLKTDIDAIIFGVLKFSDETKKVISFVKEKENSDVYKARLILSSDDLYYLDSSIFYLELINSELEQKTKPIKLSFNKDKIKLNIKQESSEQYKKVLLEIKKLNEKISALTTGKTLQSLPIKNKELIKPGMIPVAIDDKGNFVAMYPFSECISKINGYKGIDGSINIDSSMIEYKKDSGSVREIIENQTNAIQSIKNLVDEIAENLRSIQQQLNEVDMKIETHINNGII